MKRFVSIPWQLILVTIPLYVIFRYVKGTVISLVVPISASIFFEEALVTTGSKLVKDKTSGGPSNIPLHFKG